MRAGWRHARRKEQPAVVLRIDHRPTLYGRPVVLAYDLLMLQVLFVQCQLSMIMVSILLRARRRAEEAPRQRG
ncbi:hypothetical protein [Erwinia amylovora]|uniref:hypothetical protein n=1 Tax=Erwinia amylovora TaxID=552 RepID=UPI0014445546|nr:hypothetical protein [Erwinia amylovora]